MRPLARHFGVAGVIATRAAVGPDNRYTGELEFYAYGEQKAEAIRELAARAASNLAGSFAYSDSVTDVPMLEAVGHPVAVNPDRELRHIAEEREWEIRDFRSPVRLRSRIADCRSAEACGRSRRPSPVRRRSRPCSCGCRSDRASGARSRDVVTSAGVARSGLGCTVASEAERRPRGEQNPRASHAAGGMSQDPGRRTRLQGHVRTSA